MSSTSELQAGFVDRNRCINCDAQDLAEISRGRFTDSPLMEFIKADPWSECPLPYLQQSEWILARCIRCGQSFHRRILDSEWNEKRFSSWMSEAAIHDFENRAGHSSPAKQFQRARTLAEHILRIEGLTRTLRGDSAVRLLDFGCGFGEFLAACSLFGFDCAGIDRSAARRGAGLVKIYPSIDYLIDTKAFHAICLFEVLEHLDDPKALLQRLAKLIVSGGILVLETPNCEDVNGITSLDDYRKIHPLDHINAFTRSTLISIAERTGFRCIDPPAAHVTIDRLRIIKQEAKHALHRSSRGTQLYFEKCDENRS
jgi:2-polyprenyl-3-methyl-5-hydroxy-6-metoxy-1,4-benzoquinol methylase